MQKKVASLGCRSAGMRVATDTPLLTQRPDLARLVDEVGVDAIPRPENHSLGQTLGHLIVAAERCGVFEPVQSGRNALWGACAPAKRSDMLAAGRFTAEEQGHVGIVGEHFVERAQLPSQEQLQSSTPSARKFLF